MLHLPAYPISLTFNFLLHVPNSSTQSYRASSFSLSRFYFSFFTKLLFVPARFLRYIAFNTSSYQSLNMSNPSNPERRLRVIIAGGSIAGLTLAHCLERLGIDYLILEGYRAIAPQVGASIGILPNGARILDQIGCFDDIFDLVEPLGHSSTWDATGKLLSASDYPQLLEKRYVVTLNHVHVILRLIFFCVI